MNTTGCGTSQRRWKREGAPPLEGSWPGQGCTELGPGLELDAAFSNSDRFDKNLDLARSYASKACTK